MGQIPKSTALSKMGAKQMKGLNEVVDDMKEAVSGMEKDQLDVSTDSSKARRGRGRNASGVHGNRGRKTRYIPGQEVDPSGGPAGEISDAMRKDQMTKSNPVTKNLFVWLKSLKLNRLRENRIRNDLANGFAVAEILSRFFPAQVSPLSFEKAINAKAKQANWTMLQK